MDRQSVSDITRIGGGAYEVGYNPAIRNRADTTHQQLYPLLKPSRGSKALFSTLSNGRRDPLGQCRQHKGLSSGGPAAFLEGYRGNRC